MVRDRSYNTAMEISFDAKLEAKLNRMASQQAKGPEQIVQELVANHLDEG